MAGDIQLLISQGDEALEAADLEAAERCFAAALTAAVDADSKDNALRALVKLAGRFIKLGVPNRPHSLYRHLETLPLLERTRVMEWLARHHRQKGDLAEAEKIYLEIFDIKATGLGFSHEETTAALQTAALILQMQGKSPESLYLRALSGAKSNSSRPSPPEPGTPPPTIRAASANQPPTAGKSEHVVQPQKIDEIRPTISAARHQPHPPAVPPPPPQPVEPSAPTSTAPDLVPPARASNTVAATVQRTPPDPKQAGAAAKPSAENAIAMETAPVASKESTRKATGSLDLIDAVLAGPLASKAAPPKPASNPSVSPTSPLAGAVETAPQSVPPSQPTAAPSAKPRPVPEMAPPHPAPSPEPAAAGSPPPPARPETAPPAVTPSVSYPSNWHEVALVWRTSGEILSERLSANLKAKPLDKTSRTILDKLRSKIPAFMAALEKNTADKILLNTKRSSISDRIDWMIAEDLSDLYKQWSSWKKRPYEIALIYALLLRVDFLGPCHEDTLSTLHRLGYLYATDDQGFHDNEAAETLLRLSLLLHEITFGDNDRRTIHNLVNLAVIYSENQAPSAAEPLFRRALDAATRANALTQEELIELLRNFANCSELRGDFALAAELFEKMRTIFEAISLDSSELFETIHNLVVCYDRSGNFEKAKQYHQRLLWETDWLEQPNAMAMREWCATKYEEAEQFERAEQMNKDIISATQPGDQLARNALQGLVRIYERTGRHREAEKLRNPWYDPDKDRPKPQQVTSASDAVLYAAQAQRGGNLAEALEFYKAALANNTADHSVSLQIIDGLRELGAAHWRNSQLKLALETYRMAAQAAQKLLGAASIDTATCLHETAVLEDHFVEHANKAGEYFKQAFEIRLRLLGADNIDTAESAYEYARHFKGDRQHKESVLKLAIAGRERHTGLCDERTKQYIDELVRLYAEDGQLSGVAGISGPRFEFAAEDPITSPVAKAGKRFPSPKSPSAAAPIPIGADPVAALAASLDEGKNTLGVEHQDTIAKVMKIIDLYEETDESPELWTDVPAVSHLFCALSLQLVAHHFLACGDYARASATFDTVLRIREEVMGRSHPDAAMSMCDLAVLAIRTREYRDAERLYTRASEIFESRLGESNLYTAAAYHNLGVVLHKRKRKSQAETLYKKVLLMLDRSGSTEGSRKLVCIKNLESLGSNSAGED